MSDPKDFSHFGLDPALLAAIADLGYVKPTPIQAKAIPVALAGRDVMGAAQTGTGKTAGFGLPLIQRLLPHANTSASPARHPVRALVLTPTRELAEQVADNLKKYAARTTLRVACVYGGVDMEPQTEVLRRGCEIVVATPGRLLDHLQQRNTSLSQVQIVVLDEADRMLDMGFLPDISRILKLLPSQRQSLMFSATFSDDIRKLAASFLREPVVIEVARRNATADLIRQEFFKVHESEKTDALLALLRGYGRDGGPMKQVLVFVNAKVVCRRLTRQLQRAGVKADAIHGDRLQEERTRALDAFKRGDIEVLVATDVAARGLDIVELPAVINYDVPFNPEDYVHRIGRTGRAGATGLAITLMTGAEERAVAAIEKLTKLKFDIRPLPVLLARRVRGRGEGPARPASPPAPGEEFFNKPYEPALLAQPPSVPEPAAEAVPARRPGKVAALLGGGKH
ncbi:MAG: DEAD/DEAH box helicase [Sutterellaceae bacterium]|nr:DEAD/DEAH box helicase [Burkholderiaceae bacterium]MCX7902027.1 DEAD/DEAH box helicase [Burkholderiaceae bacterium]MDW8430547.1 DEAD/DEAH box helicase [Sutterellaceae bacterium]